MKKESSSFKLDWKWLVIVVLLIALIFFCWQYNVLKADADYYDNRINSLSSQLNGASGELDSYLASHDCYERGTVKCYDSTAYCYDTPKVTASCNSGYTMACVPN
ncbi:Uncharacterised protein [uncultured archaeon]|nr:Uncharacterised protein [uncultured archaeon]